MTGMEEALLSTQEGRLARPQLLLTSLGPFFALLLVFGLFAALNTKMATLTAVETIVQQTVIVGVAAIGMTKVIVSGGIDLSAGLIISLGSVVVAQLMVAWGSSPLLSAMGGILAGVLCGAANGLVITRLRVVPFIVTLGTLLMGRGLAKGLANSMPVNVDRTWLSELLAALPADKRWLLVPPGAWVMVVLAGLVAAFLRYTPLGHHIFAVGSNEQAAGLCGVGVERVKTFVYTAGGRSQAWPG